MKRNEAKNIGLTHSKSFQAMENLQEIQRLPSISPVSLDYFGAEKCDSGYTFGPFVRTSYVIHIIREGKGVLLKNGNTYEVNAGQAFLIYPCEETVYRADRKDPWSYMWVGFHGALAEEMTEKMGFRPELPVICCTKMKQVTETMENLLACCDLSYVNDLMRTGYLYQLMALLTDRDSSQLQSQEKEEMEIRYVRTAVNLLISPGNPQVKVSEVAKTIGISRGYLARIFKNRMGVSPQEFQTKFRMERAGDLLRSTGNSVTAVAVELGYTDVLSFSKSFRKYFGMSPTEFREQKVVMIAGETKGDYTSEHPL